MGWRGLKQDTPIDSGYLVLQDNHGLTLLFTPIPFSTLTTANGMDMGETSSSTQDHHKAISQATASACMLVEAHTPPSRHTHVRLTWPLELTPGTTNKCGNCLMQTSPDGRGYVCHNIVITLLANYPPFKDPQAMLIIT